MRKKRKKSLEFDLMKNLMDMRQRMLTLMPPIAYAIHQQISGYQKQVQKTAKNLFRLEVQNAGTASKLIASQQPPLALLSGIFSNLNER